MQCLTPLTISNKTKARDIFHNVPATFTFPCGKCPICLENTIKDWAIRCAHECIYHKDACHITLTMSDAYIQQRGHLRLDKTELTDFIQNLRNYLRPFKTKIKYYACGEYGTKNARPHYHIIIFGWQPLKTTNNKHGMRISPEISSLWPFGHHAVTPVNYSTCAYVAGYVSKKMFPPQENTLRGYLNEVSPEFKIQSQGIGKQWILNHYKTVMRQNAVHSLNEMYTHIKQRIPRYYLKVIKDLHLIFVPLKYVTTRMFTDKLRHSERYYKELYNRLKCYSSVYIKFCKDRLLFQKENQKEYTIDNIIASWKKIVSKHKNKMRN